MKCRKCGEGEIRVPYSIDENGRIIAPCLVDKKGGMLLVCSKCLSLFTVPMETIINKLSINGDICHEEKKTAKAIALAKKDGIFFTYRNRIRSFPTFEEFIAKI